MPSKKYTGEEENETSLKSAHELYDKYFEEWDFLNAAYEGVRALLAWGVLTQHERESQVNYERRYDEAYGFSYSRSIADLFNSFLFKKEHPRTIPDGLAANPLWQIFQEDCDMYDTDFEDFFIEQSLKASVMGHMGILVDMPSTRKENKEEEIKGKVYPYFAAYKPTNILDWEWDRDESGRPYLAYLKLLDDDGFYRIWTEEIWEVWEIIEGEGTTEIGIKEVGQTQRSKVQSLGKGAKKVRWGDNPLKEIPFAFLFNQRSGIDFEVGVSDICDVARIDASIIRNLSQIEEIINYAAFPMMRKPMKEAGTGSDKDDEVGVTAVLEFNPEYGESGKSDWLNSVVGEPVNATLGVIAKKIEEIYRSANVGGMSAMEIQNQPRSGVALKAEFQMLNSKLVKKSKAVTQTKMKCCGFWLKWQNEFDRYEGELIFEHVNTFEIEDLATDLENILTAGAVVTTSPLFSAEIQKLASRLVLPSVEDDVQNAIDDEIDANAEKEAEMREAYFNQEKELINNPPAIEGGQIPNAEVVEEEEEEQE